MCVCTSQLLQSFICQWTLRLFPCLGYYGCSVTKSRLTIWDPMDCSMSGFPILHCLPEFAQTHVNVILAIISLLFLMMAITRKTTWFPPLGKMRPLPATASQGKSPVPP